MGKRRTYLRVSQDESQIRCGAWAPRPSSKGDVANFIVFGAGGRDEEAHNLSSARYDFKGDLLSEPRSLLALDDASRPRSIAINPRCDGVVVSFDTGCRLFEWVEAAGTDLNSNVGPPEPELHSSERILFGLEDVGPQNCVLFNGNGSILACGGEDGHIRVFRWPEMVAVIDLPNAFKTVKDLDISFDSSFVSATDNKSCKVWDLSNLEEVANLAPEQGESFGLARFSRDGKKAFMFLTVMKGMKGYIGVWDLTNWSKIGAKKFLNEPITSFAVSHHGKRLAIGTKGGDISIIGIKKMELEETIKNAHLEGIISLEFSPNDKAVLSVAFDKSARVSAIDISKDWKDWQVMLILLGIFLASIAVFYLIYLHGDNFFRPPQ